MFTKIVKEYEASNYSNGTSLSGYLTGHTYSDLVKALGAPTHPSPSGDDKVQKEWVFKDAVGNGFTIYDWKTYNKDYTTSTLTKWNIGAKVEASGFIAWIQEQLKMNTPVQG